MTELLVLTYANFRNQFLDEWEESVIKNKINYKILGMGEKWEGFISKTQAIIKEINNIENNNLIVVICDAFDLFFLSGPKEILEKYNKIARGKILFGAESYCYGNCVNLQLSCAENDNHINYLNGGFLMGPIENLKKGYNFIIDNKIQDDQLGWGNYRIQNCDKIILDTSSDILVNYISTDEHELLYKDNRIYNKTYDNYPCAIHFPGQDNNYKNRSEKYRNYIFDGRNKLSLNNYTELLFVKQKKLIIKIICIVIVILFFIYLLIKYRNKIQKKF